MRLLAALPVLAALTQVDAQGLDFGKIISADPQLSSAKPVTRGDTSSIASSIISKLNSAHAQTALPATTTLAKSAKPSAKSKSTKNPKAATTTTTKKNGPAPNVAAAAASTSTGSPCSPQNIMYSYVPSPNTPNQFLVDSNLNNIAVAALAPAGYTKQFSGLSGSMENVPNYMGFYQLPSYNISQCVSYCENSPGCAAINIYFERDPVLDPGVSCSSPSAATMVKCALWGSAIGSSKATDIGEYRNDFMVVISGSNGYTKNTPPAAISSFTGPTALAGAVNVNTINGNNVFLNSSFTSGVYDPTICSSQCLSTTTKNRAAAVAAGNSSYAPCNYFDAFVVSYNSSALGTYCNLYTNAAVANYATQYSQAYNGVTYDVSYSYGYALSVVDNGVLPAVAAASTTSSASSASSTSSNAKASSSASVSSSASSSSTLTATSSSASATSTAQSCSQLASTSSNYTDASGTTFTLDCGHDLLGIGDLAAATSSSFQGCFYLCENISGCQGFTYASYTCYFKTLNGVTTQPSASSSVDLAWMPKYYGGMSSSSSSTSSTKTSSSTSSSTTATITKATTTSSATTTKSTTTSATPASSTLVATCAQLGSTFLDSNSVTYNLYCGHDFLGVGDIGNAAVSSFAACFAACDSYTSGTKKCQAIAYVGGTGAGTCYFKNMAGVNTAPNANSGVDIAWLPSAYSYTVPS